MVRVTSSATTPSIARIWIGARSNDEQNTIAAEHQQHQRRAPALERLGRSSRSGRRGRRRRPAGGCRPARPRAAACRRPAPPPRRAAGRCSGCAGAPPADRRRSAAAAAGCRASGRPACSRAGSAPRRWSCSSSPTRSTSVTLFESFSPSSSCISVRSTTRSPSASATSGNCRRRLSSPRSTSITRMPSRLKIATSITFWPISGEPSGTTTSVKNFIRLRGPEQVGHRIAVRQEPRHQQPHGGEAGDRDGDARAARSRTARTAPGPAPAPRRRPAGWSRCRSSRSCRRAPSGRRAGSGASTAPAPCVRQLHRHRDHHRDERRVVGEAPRAPPTNSPTAVSTSTLFCAARRDTSRARSC